MPAKKKTDSQEEDQNFFEDLLLTAHGEEEDSNEGILQFAANISSEPTIGSSKFRRRAPIRTQAIASEKQSVLRDPFVQTTCRQLRFFRKKKIFYKIILQALQNKEFELKYFHPTVPMFTKYSNTEYILDPAQFPGDPANSLYTWFVNSFLKNLQNIRDPNTLAETETNDHLVFGMALDSSSNLNLINQVNVALKGCLSRYHQKFGSDYPNEWIKQLLESPEDAFIELVNHLAIGYASAHKMTFANILKQHQKTGTPHHKAISASYRYNTEVRNEHTKRFHRINKGAAIPRNLKEIIVRDVIYSNTKAQEAARKRKSEGLPVTVEFLMEKHLLDLESGRAEAYDSLSEEEGWREHAGPILEKAGLDPTAYGLPRSTAERPAPPPVTRELTPPLHVPPSSYRELAQIHGSPPIDESDVSDAAEAAVDEFEEEQQSEKYLSGGEFLASPQEFVAALADIVAPNTYSIDRLVFDKPNSYRKPNPRMTDDEESSYSADEFSEGGSLVPKKAKKPPPPNSGVLEDGSTVTVGAGPLRPPSPVAPRGSSHLEDILNLIHTHRPRRVLPPTITRRSSSSSSSESSSSSSSSPPTPPPPPRAASPKPPTPRRRSSTPPLHIPHTHLRGPVHADSGTCSKLAEEYVAKWRATKKHLKKMGRIYKKKHRFFPISRFLFESGAICHRCYELVKEHHEHYHSVSGKVDYDKQVYPRKRTPKKIRSIPAPSRTSKKYQDSETAAKRYIGRLDKLRTEASYQQLRHFVKHSRKQIKSDPRVAKKYG